VSKVRVLLADMPPLLSGLLTPLIRDQPSLELVDEVSGPISLLLAVGRTQAHVVVMMGPSTGETPGICEQLLEEYPDVALYVLNLGSEPGLLHHRPITSEVAAVLPIDAFLKSMVARHAEEH
jgi:hypothetical protein